jgi:hypothetical protein
VNNELHVEREAAKIFGGGNKLDYNVHTTLSHLLLRVGMGNKYLRALYFCMGGLKVLVV